jgi:hypothetical protein
MIGVARGGGLSQAKMLGFAWFYSSESGLFNGLRPKKIKKSFRLTPSRKTSQASPFIFAPGRQAARSDSATENSMALGSVYVKQLSLFLIRWLKRIAPKGPPPRRAPAVGPRRPQRPSAVALRPGGHARFPIPLKAMGPLSSAVSRPAAPASSPEATIERRARASSESRS